MPTFLSKVNTFSNCFKNKDIMAVSLLMVRQAQERPTPFKDRDTITMEFSAVQKERKEDYSRDLSSTYFHIFTPSCSTLQK